MRCPYCNTEYPDGEKFCEICGTPLSTGKAKSQNSWANKPSPLLTQCPHCGEMHPTTISFCPKIPGKVIEASESPVAKPAQICRAKLILAGNDEIRLTDSMMTLGRSDFVRVAPADNLTYISREHLRIILDNGTYYIEDEKSRNGTWLNGDYITGKGKQSLKDGDIIDIGKVTAVTFVTY